MRRSITVQLLVPFLAVLLGVVGVGAWAAFSTAERAARRQAEAQARDAARVLEQATFPLTAQVMKQVKELSGLELVWIDSQGRRTVTAPELSSVPAEEACRAARWDQLELEGRVVIQGQPYRGSWLRLHAPGRPQGTLGVFCPEARWQGAWQEALRPTLALTAVGCLLAGACAVGWSRLLSRRVRQLVAHTQSLAAGDFQTRPLAGGQDELHALGLAVNALAEQLARYREQLQQAERLRVLHQLSGSLVHHLRNGLTGARLAVQLHVKETGDQAEPLQVALRQLHLMEERLRRVTDLSRGEELKTQRCDLVTIVTEAVELLRPQAQHWQSRLIWTPPATAVPIRGDRTQMQHLALNLIGNAIEAAGVGGDVAIGLLLEPAGGTVSLEVSDNGPGPPAHLAEKIFDPFITGKPEGMGLGLSIARQAAQQAHGRLGWFRREGHTVFAVVLPGADNEPDSTTLPGAEHDSGHAAHPSGGR